MTQTTEDATPDPFDIPWIAAPDFGNHEIWYVTAFLNTKSFPHFVVMASGLTRRMALYIAKRHNYALETEMTDTKTQTTLEPIDQLVYEALKSYRCQNIWYDEETGMPLVDLLTPHGQKTIAGGEEELGELAAHVADELRKHVNY